MLRIRAEQLNAFQPVADAQFVARIVEHLRTNHPTTVVRLAHGPTLLSRMSEVELSELVKNGVGRARKYGLSWESSISAFVVLMFCAAPNFDQHKAITEILSNSQIPPDDRIKVVVDKIDSNAWTEIKDRYDPAAWKRMPAGADK